MTILAQDDIVEIAHKLFECAMETESGFELEEQTYESKNELSYIIDQNLPNNFCLENLAFEQESVTLGLQNGEELENYYEVSLTWAGDVHVSSVGGCLSKATLDKLNFEKLFTPDLALLLRWYSAIEHEAFKQIERSSYGDQLIDGNIMRMLTNPQWGLNDLVVKLVFTGVIFDENTITNALAQ